MGIGRWDPMEFTWDRTPQESHGITPGFPRTLESHGILGSPLGSHPSWIPWDPVGRSVGRLIGLIGVIGKFVLKINKK